MWEDRWPFYVGVTLLVGFLLFCCALAAGWIPTPAPPACSAFANTPREDTPARCFDDFHPERP